jgi:hypothetical protein
MTEIKEVRPRADYQLEVLLSNGGSVTLNLKPKLQTIRFGLLRDEAFFRRAQTDGTVIRWGNKVELSAGEVFELIKK